MRVIAGEKPEDSISPSKHAEELFTFQKLNL
jgi:hypothetical protein